jgi:hypothetical protein
MQFLKYWCHRRPEFIPVEIVDGIAILRKVRLWLKSETALDSKLSAWILSSLARSIQQILASSYPVKFSLIFKSID